MYLHRWKDGPIQECYHNRIVTGPPANQNNSRNPCLRFPAQLLWPSRVIFRESVVVLYDVQPQFYTPRYCNSELCYQSRAKHYQLFIRWILPLDPILFHFLRSRAHLTNTYFPSKVLLQRGLDPLDDESKPKRLGGLQANSQSCFQIDVSGTKQVGLWTSYLGLCMRASIWDPHMLRCSYISLWKFCMQGRL